MFNTFQFFLPMNNDTFHIFQTLQGASSDQTKNGAEAVGTSSDQTKNGAEAVDTSSDQTKNSAEAVGTSSDQSRNGDEAVDTSSGQPLTLSYRLIVSIKSKTHRAPDHLVLTWEEFFMGLAELQRVFCDFHDTNVTAKVWVYCN